MATKKAAKKKAPAKKAAKKAAKKVKVVKKVAPKKATGPITEKLTKGQVVASIADSTGLSKKQVGTVMEEFQSMIERSIRRKGAALSRPSRRCCRRIPKPCVSTACLPIRWTMRPAT